MRKILFLGASVMCFLFGCASTAKNLKVDFPVVHENNRGNKNTESDFKRNYDFKDGLISEDVLKSYLSRSITMTQVANYSKEGECREDAKRMLKEIGAKFIGRSMLLWGVEKLTQSEKYYKEGKKFIDELHDFDPEIIFQACIFEIITTNVNVVKIPKWVFDEFDIPYEPRNFSYDAMLNKSNMRVNHWRWGASVPDITRLETKMWFFFNAKKYIDIGVEAIHFGQVELMLMDDIRNVMAWDDVLTRVRAYALKNARRGTVLCDGHMTTGGLKVGEKLLFDFNSYPLRPKSVEGQEGHTILEKGYLNAIFGRTAGGITPSGWSTNALPYLAELDNFGISDHPGQYQPDDFQPWGYDEITWFSLQPEEYRNEWLEYAWRWIRQNDKSGFLQMPGTRSILTRKGKLDTYWANRKGACIDGYSQEDTIREIWKSSE